MNVEINKVLDLMAAKIGHLEKENALLKAQLLSTQENDKKDGVENGNTTNIKKA